ncbi:MAG: copper-containing nitrite reductase [Proteobacteria bacterium]|nr:copper-containing nitrite reductase [Pseudomonadota bacterium]
MTTPLAAAEPAELGAKVFRKCQACHSPKPDVKKVGPSLHGVFGRAAASVDGYVYSSALKQFAAKWDEATLDAFLADPAKAVPGNKMTFGGLRSAQDRKSVIAFLQSISDTGAASAAAAPVATAPAVVTTSDPSIPAGYIPDVKYTLRTGIAEGRMVYIGFGGTIDGVVNPELFASEGDIVQLTLINGEGAEHDIVLLDQGVQSQHVVNKGSSTTIAFRAKAGADSAYFCSIPGHRQAGMEGKFTVAPKTAAPADTVPGIGLSASALPPPIGGRAPKTVQVELDAVELEGMLADGTTYQYWTFNGTVPGPFLRVRVGDTVQVRMKNDENSAMIHSVDFHATTGPGGGAAYLQVEPGGEKRLDFKALVPGIYVYHCATPMVAHHIANGMYGLILVEPEGGLPPVDREFYVMQGEIYTEAAFGQHGSQEFSVEKLLAEKPEYFVFNGAVGALTKQHPLQAKVGETVRIYMGVGGPNFTSSFHVIGEMFDRVYTMGDLLSPPLRGIQTVPVPPGGAVAVDFKLEVPGRYLLVDHALSRLERGLLGFLMVEGADQPEIYKPHDAAASE